MCLSGFTSSRPHEQTLHLKSIILNRAFVAGLITNSPVSGPMACDTCVWVHMPIHQNHRSKTRAGWQHATPGPVVVCLPKPIGRDGNRHIDCPPDDSIHSAQDNSKTDAHACHHRLLHVFSFHTLWHVVVAHTAVCRFPAAGSMLSSFASWFIDLVQ